MGSVRPRWFKKIAEGARSVTREVSGFLFLATVFTRFRSLASVHVGQLWFFSKFVSDTVDGRKLWAETILALILGRVIGWGGLSLQGNPFTGLIY
jgi:hypothetical protein